MPVTFDPWEESHTAEINSVRDGLIESVAARPDVIRRIEELEIAYLRWIHVLRAQLKAERGARE